MLVRFCLKVVLKFWGSRNFTDTTSFEEFSRNACQKEFLAYFNALETYSGIIWKHSHFVVKKSFTYMYLLFSKNLFIHLMFCFFLLLENDIKHTIIQNSLRNKRFFSNWTGIHWTIDGLHIIHIMEKGCYFRISEF